MVDLNALALQLAEVKRDSEYILGDEVRVECPCGYGQYPHILNSIHCERGRGWLPLDPEKLGQWMETAEKICPKVSIYKNLYTGKWHAHINQLKGYECSKGNTPSEAFFLALNNAIQIIVEERK